MAGTWSNVRWQFQPGEVLRPTIYVELKFESHVGRKRHEIVLIVGGVNATHNRICAYSERLDLVAAFDNVARWEQARHFKDVDDVEYDDSPAIHVQVEWDLDHKVVLSAHLLVQVA